MLVDTQTLRLRLPTGVIAVCLALMGLAILNLASAARLGATPLHWVHFVRCVVACCIGGVAVLIPTNRLRQLAWPLYVLSLVLLMAVLVVGVTVKGAQRWVDLKVTRLQPSELAKLSVLLALASFCARDWPYKGYTLRRLVRMWALWRPVACVVAAFCFVVMKYSLVRDVLFSSRLAVAACVLLHSVLGFWLVGCIRFVLQRGWRWHQQVSIVDVVAAPAALVFMQPDLGTTLLLLAPLACMILFCGVRARSLLLACFLFVGCAVGAWYGLLQDYQKQRVYSLLQPKSDLRGSGYHAAQSLIAIGSGKWMGKGFGEGTQTQLSFLPESRTDFVFALWAEEWGLFGSLLVLGLFAVLVGQMLHISQRATDRFGQLLAFGTACLVFWHVVVNVGMVLGLLPVVGAALPFLSYGGTSLLLHVLAVSLCVNVAVWRRKI
ncbi:MAG: FtsW/RodA/SpoVE family cell cycle protein [Myxococcota bacterium]